MLVMLSSEPFKKPPGLLILVYLLMPGSLAWRRSVRKFIQKNSALWSRVFVNLRRKRPKWVLVK